MQEPCFEQLRNQEQLGYIVETNVNSQAKVIGG